MATSEAPINVKLQEPLSVDPNRWTQEARMWADLNTDSGGHPGFHPLTIKAAYVLGVIHDVCESVDWLLKFPQAWPVTYPSAFGLCAAGMELLGRCLRGNQGTRGSSLDLKTGFEWLKSSTPRTGISPSALTVTRYNDYEIDRLVTLRHFTLHGQATVEVGKAIVLDIELLNDFPWLIGNAIEMYWDKLLNSEHYCEQLAKANVLPLRSAPLRKIWRLFGRQGTSAGTAFYAFDWQIDPPYWR